MFPRQGISAVSDQCSEDDSQLLLINLDEEEKIKSGIDNWQIAVDGESVTPETERVLSTAKLADGKEIVSGMELGIRMTYGTHAVSVVAMDRAGNAATEEFTVQIEPEDLISVVLPTTFDIAVLPGDSANQVYSDDIVICNKSDFPLDVEVSQVQVSVDKSTTASNVLQGTLPTGGDDSVVYDLTPATKSCDLEMKLLTAYQSEQTFATPEGGTDSVTSFRLADACESTDPKALQGVWNTESVDSADYAVVRFHGTITGDQDAWKDGDLKVQVVFSFAKDED
jgi:hypothetical protein